MTNESPSFTSPLQEHRKGVDLTSECFAGIDDLDPRANQDLPGRFRILFGTDTNGHTTRPFTEERYRRIPPPSRTDISALVYSIPKTGNVLDSSIQKRIVTSSGGFRSYPLVTTTLLWNSIEIRALQKLKDVLPALK